MLQEICFRAKSLDSGISNYNGLASESLLPPSLVFTDFNSYHEQSMGQSCLIPHLRAPFCAPPEAARSGGSIPARLYTEDRFVFLPLGLA